MNKETLRRVTRYLKPCSRACTGLINRRIPQRLIVTYHGISKRPQFNCTTTEELREQISWVKQRYRVVPLGELVTSLVQGEDRPEDLLSITFDDGFTNFAELALPILQEAGCSATVFVPAGKVGGYNDWDVGAPGFRKMRIMSFDELRQLPEATVEIGCHGKGHAPLSRSLPAERLREEIVDSKQVLQDMTSREIRFFAFPYGVSPFLRKGDRFEGLGPLASHYTAACSSRWGRWNRCGDLFNLRRIGIWQSDSFRDFTDKMTGLYDWLVVKEKIGNRLKRLRGG